MKMKICPSVRRQGTLALPGTKLGSQARNARDQGESRAFSHLSREARRQLYPPLRPYLSIEKDTEIWSTSLQDRLRLYYGDIVELEVGAIVNAANKTCMGGGGVDGAIHDAAGPELLDECRLLGGCLPGQAKATGAFRLPADYIIHAVGPNSYDPRLLRQTYMSALNIALTLGVSSVAFPCISTGVFGFPNDAAAIIVCETLFHFFRNHSIVVVLCLFTPQDREAYNKALSIYFP